MPGTMDRLEPAGCVGEGWPDRKSILISGRQNRTWTSCKEVFS
jgi:hypothetical protein